MVELGLPTLGGLGVHDIWRARDHAADQRLRVRAAPRGAGALDRGQVGDQVDPVTESRGDVLGRLLFDALPFDVRGEELPVGGNHIAAQGGLLVTQRALQLIRRDTRRLNVIGQLTGHCVGAVQQHRTCGCAGQHHRCHDRQHHGLPARDRQSRSQLRAARRGVSPAPSIPSSPDAALYPHHGDVVAEPAMRLGPSLGLVDERVDELRAGQRRQRPGQFQ